MPIGIDGCRAGWVVAAIDEENQLSLHQVAKLASLKSPAGSIVYIDIPLGFANGQYRLCEIEARRLLGPQKRASVFFTPHKEAVYANTFEEANALNKARMGKGVSIQAWNICPKIREAIAFDALPGSPQLYEAHPELCFYYLNNRLPVLSKKSSPQGIADRLKIVTSVSAQYGQVIEEMINSTKRKDLKMDDVLDATVLAIRAGAATRQQVPMHTSSPGSDMIFY